MFGQYVMNTDYDSIDCAILSCGTTLKELCSESYENVDMAINYLSSSLRFHPHIINSFTHQFYAMNIW